MKRVFQNIILFFALLFLLVSKADAASSVRVYLFYSKTCPHCARERDFINSIKSEYDYVTFHEYEVNGTLSNTLLYNHVRSSLKIASSGVPLTIIGEEYFTGYLDDTTSGATIQSLIEKYHQNGDPDVVGSLIQEKNEVSKEKVENSKKEQENETTDEFIGPVKEEVTISIPESVMVPFIGEVKLKMLSLPVLTVVIAFLDGFNPCAMWVLLFLISMLLGMQNKFKMWTLGTVFIAVSGFVYFLFLAAWLNVFQLLGFVSWLRFAVGIFALGAGLWQLREFYTNTEGGCDVVDDTKRKRIFDRIRTITKEKSFLAAIIGISILAVIVNMIELVCSAGLPAIYTHMLSLSELPSLQYYLYLFLYILIFMLDDLFVFIVAMKTLHMTALSTKYARFSKFAGGIIIFIIGILMLVKPEILTFGSL